MRIIAGTLKGRRLVAPAGRSIRPTADRVRESIFNILGDFVYRKRVLDLFAGTGAMGIEAISRGAVSAVFVDRDPAALSAIRTNIQGVKIGDCTRVIRWNILRRLDKIVPSWEAFDLIFMDPPYNSGAVMPALMQLPCGVKMAPDTRVVIEHSPLEPIAPHVNALEQIDQRRYGKTLVTIMGAML